MSSPYICPGAPLTCPGHQFHPLTGCQPPPVDVTEVDVISRQVPAPDRLYPTSLPAGQINATLLQEVLAFLDRNITRWTQHRYLSEVDGVLVGCVAGWAVVMGGIDFDTPEFLLSARDGIELHRRGREVLGFSEFQAGAVFGFTHVTEHGLAGEVERHPTFAELCHRIFEVTDVRYNPQGHAA